MRGRESRGRGCRRGREGIEENFDIDSSSFVRCRRARRRWNTRVDKAETRFTPSEKWIEKSSTVFGEFVNEIVEFLVMSISEFDEIGRFYRRARR